ncbi:MAG: hypothetical protein LBR76_04475 [Oscillospiraceae bacterium]|jgi:REP element-mobilizing transposase RayT|nr:hypothetical protein [Oscillospiraceae bacterium]
MRFNECGKIAEDELLKIPSHYGNVQIDRYVVMPNHIHIIVVIRQAERNDCRTEQGVCLTERINPFPTKSDIPNIIGQYKAGVTRSVGNAFMRSAAFMRSDIWQSRFHDHIIRNEADYQRICQYIDENPAKWQEDRYFAKHTE